MESKAVIGPYGYRCHALEIPEAAFLRGLYDPDEFEKSFIAYRNVARSK